MVRTLLIVAAAGFFLMLVSFGGAAALGGPELMRGGWSLDLDDWDDDGDHGGVSWSGPSIERSMEWSGGDTLTIAVPADVTFTQGPEASVTIRGPQEAVEMVTLVDGRLGFADGAHHDNRIHVLGRSDGLEVTITAPDVSRFVLEGFGDVDLNGIDRERLDLVVSGAGSIEAVGRAQQLNLTVEGAGDVDLEELVAQNAEIRIAGAGEAEVNAVQSANVVVEGVGDVNFVGRPARLTQDVQGIGSVSVSE